MSVNPPKPPLTFEAQMKLLMSRGLLVENEVDAVLTLGQINYYRLRGYYIHLSDGDVFKENVSFEQIVGLHSFDSELRSALLKLLLDIEIVFRTRLAYAVGHAWGPLGYDVVSNYYDPEQKASKLLDDIKADIARSKERFVRVHKEKYGGQYPIWVAVETMSFGNLSKLFSLLPLQLHRQIGHYFKDVHYAALEPRFHTATILRNMCAHNSRIYARTIPVGVQFSKDENEQLRRFYPSFTVYGTSLFAALIIVRSITPKNIWNGFLANLTLLFSKYKGRFEFHQIGFPYGWIEMLGNKF